jgi:hypothetical protein
MLYLGHWIDFVAASRSFRGYCVVASSLLRGPAFTRMTAKTWLSTTDITIPRPSSNRRLNSLLLNSRTPILVHNDTSKNSDFILRQALDGGRIIVTIIDSSIKQRKV